MGGGALRPAALACGLAAALSACAPAPPDAPPGPPAAPEDAPASEAPAALRPPLPDPTSASLRAYYARVERGLLAQGLLREDGGGPDTPYSARRLAETFVRLALFEEYDIAEGRLVGREAPSVLRRWPGPVRIATAFGASVPASDRARDDDAVSRYAARLARVTGHPVTATSGAGNLTVFVVSEAERRTLGPALRRSLPGIGDAAIATVATLPRDTYCFVVTADPGDDGRLTSAVAVIRAELPERLRLGCLHEEIAQGLGLTNDSPRARPSIFNDDEEFGLLTTHDEDLLAILYDPRLAPGMTAAEAAPIAARIAAERAGGEG